MYVYTEHCGVHNAFRTEVCKMCIFCVQCENKMPSNHCLVTSRRMRKQREIYESLPHRLAGCSLLYSRVCLFSNETASVQRAIMLTLYAHGLHV